MPPVGLSRNNVTWYTAALCTHSDVGQSPFSLSSDLLRETACFRWGPLFVNGGWLRGAPSSWNYRRVIGSEGRSFCWNGSRCNAGYHWWHIRWHHRRRITWKCWLIGSLDSRNEVGNGRQWANNHKQNTVHFKMQEEWWLLLPFSCKAKLMR